MNILNSLFISYSNLYGYSEFFILTDVTLKAQIGEHKIGSFFFECEINLENSTITLSEDIGNDNVMEHVYQLHLITGDKIEETFLEAWPG